jgi:CYTH domain-containing protein
MCDKPLIEKTRHIYNTDNVKWEIDEFHGANNGLLLAEIELLSEDQKIVLPKFIVKEVTGLKEYYNSMLQKNPYTTWKNNSSK